MKVEVEIPEGKYCRDSAGWTCDLLGLSQSSDGTPIFCVRINADVEIDDKTLKPIKHPGCPSLKEMAK